MGDDTLVLRLTLIATAGLSVAAGGGLVAAALYARAGRGPLMRPVGPVAAAPTGPVVIGAFVIFLLTTQVFYSLVGTTGLLRLVYGPGFPTGWPEKTAGVVRYLWVATVAAPAEVVLISLLVRYTGRTIPWGGRNWAPNVVAGYLTWLAVTPAAFIVFVLANLVHTWLTRQPPDKHPLTELGGAGGAVEWALFLLQTILLAPLLEELLFRGLLLPWLAQKTPADPDNPLTVPPARRPVAIMLLAVLVAVVLHLDDGRKAWGAGDWTGAAAHLVPGAFFLALVPLLFLVPASARLRRHFRLRSRQQVEAILASSALFAAVHANVWPSPVALFVLAVGLGYLYVRTRTLIGPVVVHGLFNAVSAVYLLLGGPA